MESESLGGVCARRSLRNSRRLFAVFTPEKKDCKIHPCTLHNRLDALFRAPHQATPKKSDFECRSFKNSLTQQQKQATKSERV